MKPFFSISRMDELLKQEKMDAMVLCQPSSYGYFTTIPWRDRSYFPGIGKDVTVPIAGYVRRRPDEAFAAVAHIDMADVKQRGCWIDDLRPVNDLGPYEQHAGTIVAILNEKGLGAGRVGLERSTLPYGFIVALEELAPRIEWVECIDVLHKLQEFKSEEELRRLRRACEVNENGMLKVLDSLRVGATPRDLNGIYLTSVAGVCCERYGHFHPITFGDHHLKRQPFNEVRLQPETLIHIDQSLVYNGLISDVGRNFYFGNRIPAEVTRISDACIRTVEAVSESLRPGIPCAEVDRLSRETFYDIAGESADFRLGLVSHGAGWILYSYPFISPNPQGEILPGHVFTLEVFVHYPGLGHFKCEDLFAMHDDGLEKLNKLERKLFVKPC